MVRNFDVKITGEPRDTETVTRGSAGGSWKSVFMITRWLPTQLLYAHYIEQALGIKVAGIIYNILVKARLQQSKGETQDEFEVRRAELLAKSKTGKTTATRKMPESDDAFADRLMARYTELGMFHREMLYISRDQFETLQTDIWELTQQFLDCRRRGVFYQNTSYCFFYHRPCAYFALCRSGGSPNVIENFYEHKAAHEELREDDTNEELSPF